MSLDKKFKVPQRTWSFAYYQYKFLLGLPLETKIRWAEELIVSELGKSKRPSLACSWGKTSVALLHLVLSHCDRVAVVFHNTGVHYPEILKYRDRLLDLWKIDNYVETIPEKSFWEVVEESGFPKIRTLTKKGRRSTPACCYHLKEKPARIFLKENKIDLEFVGIQAEEANVRRISFLREGFVYDSSFWGTRVCRPLITWTDADVWAYHKKVGIPHNPIYDRMKRTGCMACTGYMGWKETLARTNPKMYRIVTKKMGIRLLDDWGCGE